jgi:hypothetical protein
VLRRPFMHDHARFPSSECRLFQMEARRSWLFHAGHTSITRKKTIDRNTYSRLAHELERCPGISARRAHSHFVKLLNLSETGSGDQPHLRHQPDGCRKQVWQYRAAYAGHEPASLPASPGAYCFIQASRLAIAWVA